MYQPELKVDNKPLYELPMEVWIIKIGDVLVMGQEANSVVKNTEMMAMKYALSICKKHNIPLWISVNNTITGSTIKIT